MKRVSKHFTDASWLPVACDDCGKDGFIRASHPEGNYYISCANGSHMTSSVWCSKCGIGGAFVSGIASRPAVWQCPKCKSEYSIPDSFYLNPVRMYPLATLPLAEQTKWKPKGLHPLVYVLVFLFILVDFIVTVILPNR